MSDSSLIRGFYAKLGRSTIPALDGMRALAIALVLCYHFDIPPNAPGPLGVTIFFVLSGFLITWLLLKEYEKTGTISLRQFYKRRALRIFPAFYTYWLLCVVGLMWTRHNVPWPEFGSSFLYFSNYYYTFATPTKFVMPFTWSLAVEEQFYLLWPTVFLLYRNDLRRLTRFLVGLIICVWVYRAGLYFIVRPSELYLQHSFDTRVDHLMSGALLAVLLKRQMLASYLSAVCRNRLMPLVVVGLLSISIYLERYLGPGFDYRHVLGYVVEPALIATFIVQMIAFGEDGAWSWINSWPLRKLGVLSYSVYLYHLSVGRLVFDYFPHVKYRYQLLGCFVGSLIAAALSHYLIERPFLRLKNRQGSAVPADEGVRPVPVVAGG